MKSLLLSGYNIHLHVSDDKLIVMDGRGWNKEPTEMIFQLNFMSYDNIIIYGQSGNVTLSAINWLMRHKVSINIIDSDGTFLTSMNPPQLKFGHVKMAQYKAYQRNRIEIGKKFIEARIKGIETILRWLDERYSGVRPHTQKMNFKKILEDLNKTRTDRDILKMEGDLTHRYWEALKEIVPENFDPYTTGTEGSDTLKDSMEQFRALFKYGYAVLESICLGAINGANLDPYIGFIHRMEISRSPLVEDFKGPYQWLVDKTIIQAVENGLFSKVDFIRGEDSTLQLKPDSLRVLIEELDRTFSQSIKYRGRNHQWYVLVQIKIQELSQYFTNNRKDLDFTTPGPLLEKLDSKEIRDRILNISYRDWKKKGYSHGSLHYLKQCARSNKPLKLTQQNAEKLDSMFKDG